MPLFIQRHALLVDLWQITETLPLKSEEPIRTVSGDLATQTQWLLLTRLIPKSLSNFKSKTSSGKYTPFTSGINKQ